jgi:hypothetical protein
MSDDYTAMLREILARDPHSPGAELSRQAIAPQAEAVAERKLRLELSGTGRWRSSCIRTRAVLSQTCQTRCGA